MYEQDPYALPSERLRNECAGFTGEGPPFTLESYTNVYSDVVERRLRIFEFPAPAGE